tara:strand:+ start:119 stop:1834 length:1716 start_codon:yes stop_codon:yes gene_type:complete
MAVTREQLEELQVRAVQGDPEAIAALNELGATGAQGAQGPRIKSASPGDRNATLNDSVRMAIDAGASIEDIQSILGKTGKQLTPETLDNQVQQSLRQAPQMRMPNMPEPSLPQINTAPVASVQARGPVDPNVPVPPQMQQNALRGVTPSDPNQSYADFLSSKNQALRPPGEMTPGQQQVNAVADEARDRAAVESKWFTEQSPANNRGSGLLGVLGRRSRLKNKDKWVAQQYEGIKGASALARATADKKRREANEDAVYRSDVATFGKAEAENRRNIRDRRNAKIDLEESRVYAQEIKKGERKYDAGVMTLKPFQDSNGQLINLNVDARGRHFYQNGSLVPSEVMSTLEVRPARKIDAKAKTPEQTEKAQGTIKRTVQENIQNLAELTNMQGAISSANKTAGENILSYVRGSTPIDAMVGSKRAEITSQIKQSVGTLLLAVKDATGLTAGELNSKFELQTYMAIINDPKATVEAQASALSKINELYGTGEVLYQIPDTETEKLLQDKVKNSEVVGKLIAPLGRINPDNITAEQQAGLTEITKNYTKEQRLDFYRNIKFLSSGRALFEQGIVE